MDAVRTVPSASAVDLLGCRPDPAALERAWAVRVGEFVQQGVEALVDLLAGRVRVVPGDQLPRAHVERDGRARVPR